MTSVRSMAMSTSIAGGMEALRLGSSALMRSTVSITLAAGVLKAIRRTAGLPSKLPPV